MTSAFTFPVLSIAACLVFGPACTSIPSRFDDKPKAEAGSTSKPELSVDNPTTSEGVVERQPAGGTQLRSPSLPAGAIRGEFSWQDGAPGSGGHFRDAILIQSLSSEPGLFYDVDGGQLFAHEAQRTTGVTVDGRGPGHHIVRSTELNPVMALKAGGADVVEDRGRARLRLTIAGRVAFVSLGRFRSSAADLVTYADLDVGDGVDSLRASVLRGVAESAVVTGESAQLRCLDGAHWADYAGLMIERGFACFERQRVVFQETSIDIVNVVVPRGAAKLRVLLWGGFWRDQIPSIEESILRDDAAKLLVDV